MNDMIENLVFSRSDKKSQIQSLIVQQIGRISKKKNKLVSLRYLGYITGEFH